MNSIQAGLSDAIKDAMRAKDTVALTALRALKSAFLVLETAPGATGEISETEAVAAVRKQIKQREDSIAQFVQAGRTELAEKEKAEIAVLERFLPKPLSDQEIEALVTAALAETGASTKAQMGAVMKLVTEGAAGRADGKALSQAVMKRLG
ncbi:MAG: GatB/YqeY domain-containing protein [Verrucomicrobiales bacterium]